MDPLCCCIDFEFYEQTSAVESHGIKRRIAELNQPICFRTVLTSKWKPPPQKKNPISQMKVKNALGKRVCSRFHRKQKDFLQINMDYV